MKPKDIELFNKLIHNTKRIVSEIKQERVQHNKEMQNHLNELLEVIEEAYELYEDLSNGEGK